MLFIALIISEIRCAASLDSVTFPVTIMSAPAEAAVKACSFDSYSSADYKGNVD